MQLVSGELILELVSEVVTSSMEQNVDITYFLEACNVPLTKALFLSLFLVYGNFVYNCVFIILVLGRKWYNYLSVHSLF